MSETEFDRIIDAVRKELAPAPVKDSSGGLWASGVRTKSAADKGQVGRYANPPARIRRVGEGQKRYR